MTVLPRSVAVSSILALALVLAPAVRADEAGQYYPPNPCDEAFLAEIGSLAGAANEVALGVAEVDTCSEPWSMVARADHATTSLSIARVRLDLLRHDALASGAPIGADLDATLAVAEDEARAVLKRIRSIRQQAGP